MDVSLGSVKLRSSHVSGQDRILLIAGPVTDVVQCPMACVTVLAPPAMTQPRLYQLQQSSTLQGAERRSRLDNIVDHRA